MEKIPAIALKKTIKFEKYSFYQLRNFVLTAACVLLVVFGLNFLAQVSETKKSVLGDASDIYSEIKKLSSDLNGGNMDSADKIFGSIAEKFSTIKTRIDSLGVVVNNSPLGLSAQNLSSAAYKIAQSGTLLLDSVAVFTQPQSVPRNDNGFLDYNFYEKNRLSYEKNLQVLNLIREASTDLAKVKSLPDQYNEVLDYTRSQISSLEPVLSKYVKMQKLYLDLFDGSKTYFLAFQNSDELRANGGFIGTYGVLQTNDGDLVNLKIDSIYNLDAKIYSQISAPGPFQPSIQRFGIRDANWFADASESAKKILYFYEQGEQTADGVIFFTPQVFEKLLQVIGPVNVKNYGIEVNAENFQNVVQFQTSVAYDPSLKQPKKFLADFAQSVLEILKASDLKKKIQIIDILDAGFLSKESSMYSKNINTQSLIEELNWGGKIKQAKSDYLSIISSNLGGTKSDRKISRRANLRTKIFNDGTVMDNLQITFSSVSAQDNKSFVRILVPKNSVLLSANGFEPLPQNFSKSQELAYDVDLKKWDEQIAYDYNVATRVESDKQEFSGWVQVPFGRTANISISYIVPINADENYSILIQPQSGSNALNFSQSLQASNRNIFWKNDLYQQVNGDMSLSDMIDKDKEFDIIFMK
jgi:hypothetical protein